MFSDENPQRDFIAADLRSECKKAGIKQNLRSENGKIDTAINLLMSSKAKIVIIPFHDLKRFGEEARINAPSVFSDKNWSFRFLASDFDNATKNRLKARIKRYGRN